MPLLRRLSPMVCSGFLSPIHPRQKVSQRENDGRRRREQEIGRRQKEADERDQAVRQTFASNNNLGGTMPLIHLLLFLSSRPILPIPPLSLLILGFITQIRYKPLLGPPPISIQSIHEPNQTDAAAEPLKIQRRCKLYSELIVD